MDFDDCSHYFLNGVCINEGCGELAPGYALRRESAPDPRDTEIAALRRKLAEMEQLAIDRQGICLRVEGERDAARRMLASAMEVGNLYCAEWKRICAALDCPPDPFPMGATDWEAPMRQIATLRRDLRSAHEDIGAVVAILPGPGNVVERAEAICRDLAATQREADRLREQVDALEGAAAEALALLSINGAWDWSAAKILRSALRQVATKEGTP